MGTVSFVAAADALSPIDSNQGYQSYGTITMSSSYAATTGDSIPANMGGVGNITFLNIAVGISTGTNPAAGAYLGVPVYNASGVLTGIRVYQTGTAGSTPFVEMGAVDLSNLTFSVQIAKSS